MSDNKEILAMIPQSAKDLEEYVIQCRRTLHRFAETGGREIKTSAFIAGEARKLGLPVEKVSNTGMIVTLDTGRPGNGIALRADMDALPIKENACNMKGPKVVVSDDPATCHACGHDGHMAMLLGAMKLLCSIKDRLQGRIYFCFEEGEEVFYGWQAMVKALPEKNINSVFGIHLYSALESGKVCVSEGPKMAGIIGVDADFIGRGGHGSRPDLSINPVYAAASAMTNLSVAFSNQIDADETVTLGITSIVGGGILNIIPDRAKVLGTLRFFNTNEGFKAKDIMRTVFTDTAHMNRCTVEFPDTVLLLPTVNDRDASRFAEETFAKVLPENSLVNNVKWYASESFGEYMRRYKGALAFVGIRNEEKGMYAEHHNEHFDIDEDALLNGTICYAAYAAAGVFDEKIAGWHFTEPEE